MTYQPHQSEDATMKPVAGAPDPSPKELDTRRAAHAHVETMIPRKDGGGVFPYWHGWALRESFLAGAEWQESRPSPKGEPELPEPQLHDNGDVYGHEREYGYTIDQTREHGAACYAAGLRAGMLRAAGIAEEYSRDDWGGAVGAEKVANAIRKEAA